EVATFEDRAELHAYVNSSVVNHEAVDYLEFGVYKGESIRMWTTLNSNPGSRFFGFDSFEGLPEDWKQGASTLPAGHFTTGGALPQIDDRRVQFIKGWFQDTLEDFAAGFQPRNRLVVHLDADLYTSTLFVLAVLNRFLVPGSVLIFDEFSRATGEFKALTDYTGSFKKVVRPIACSGGFWEQSAFEIF
ncbi:MAG TPA: TylF/MycF/NovP-related O-methyltransferase, partial [Bryobacteraceae bacterium]|nr:TylF/MycF/NovP-related O-methyltransferase [Bryobacteraceae bacterium]